jgi:hypothetical protein
MKCAVKRVNLHDMHTKFQKDWFRRTHTHTHTRHGDFISLLLFFKNKVGQ